MNDAWLLSEVALGSDRTSGPHPLLPVASSSHCPSDLMISIQMLSPLELSVGYACDCH